MAYIELYTWFNLESKSAPGRGCHEKSCLISRASRALLGVLPLDSGFLICLLALTRGRQDGFHRNTTQTNNPYDVPFRALFEHDDGIFFCLHALKYTTYEDFSYSMPFGALFEHDSKIFSILHVCSVQVISPLCLLRGGAAMKKAAWYQGVVCWALVLGQR